MATTPLSRAEFTALGALKNARVGLLVDTFKGTELKFGTVSAAKTAKKMVSSVKGVHKGGKALSSGSKAASTAVSFPGVKAAVEKFMVECADVSGIADIAAAITEGVVQDILAEIVPLVGIVYSGVKLAKAAKAVVEDGHNLYKFSDYRKGFLRGDPVAAADAVKTIIQRDLATHSIQLAQQAVATGGKIAGILGDGGTATTAAIGLANALASLGLELYALGRAIKEMKAGNERLQTPETLDLTVFETCPVLGCYLLTCADTSSIANFFVADIGLPGWMDKVEHMKKNQMDPLLAISRKAIAASRIQLTGLAQNKSMSPSKGFFASLKSKAKKKLGIT